MSNGWFCSQISHSLANKETPSQIHKRNKINAEIFITCVHESSRVCPKIGHSSKSYFYFYFQSMSKGTCAHPKTTEIYNIYIMHKECTCREILYYTPYF